MFISNHFQYSTIFQIQIPLDNVNRAFHELINRFINKLYNYPFVHPLSKYTSRETTTSFRSLIVLTDLTSKHPMEETRLVPQVLSFRLEHDSNLSASRIISNQRSTAGCSLTISCKVPSKLRGARSSLILSCVRYGTRIAASTFADGNRLFPGRMSHYIARDSSYRTANDAKNRVQS